MFVIFVLYFCYMFCYSVAVFLPSLTMPALQCQSVRLTDGTACHKPAFAPTSKKGSMAIHPRKATTGE